MDEDELDLVAVILEEELIVDDPKEVFETDAELGRVLPWLTGCGLETLLDEPEDWDESGERT